jgi:hypothetical protein
MEILYSIRQIVHSVFLQLAGRIEIGPRLHQLKEGLPGGFAVIKEKIIGTIEVLDLPEQVRKNLCVPQDSLAHVEPETHLVFQKENVLT